MLRRLAELIYDSPGAAAAVLVALLGLAGWGAAQLQIDFSSTSFYRGGDEMVPQLREFQRRWGPDDDVLMVVVEADDEGVLTEDRLTAMRRLESELIGLEDVRSVDSITSQQVPVPGDPGSAMSVADLVSTFSGTDPERRKMLKAVPWVPLLLSVDGRYAAIAVELEFSSDDLATVVPAVEQIEAVVKRHDRKEGLSFGLAGVPAIRAGFFALTIRDQMIFVPAALVLIGICLFVVFRRIHGVVIPAAAAGLPLFLLVGSMGLWGEPIGLINQAYFTLIPVLAVADAIHLISRYYEESTREGPREAVARAVEHVGLACTLTTLTTALAFVSLGIGGMPILRNFGLFAGLGMVLAYGVVLVSLPLLVRISPGKPRADAAAPRIVALGRIGTRRPGLVLVLALAIGGAMGTAGSQVVVDNRLSALLQPDHPVRQASARLDESLGGTLSLELDLEGKAGAFLEPGVLDEVAEFESWALDQPGVRAVIGPGRPAKLYAGLTRSKTDTPDGVRAVYDALDQVRAVSGVIQDDFGQGRISIRVAETGGRAFERFADEVNQRAQDTLGPHGLQVAATGTTLLAYRGVNRVAEDLRSSLLVVFGVVSFLILVLFRSPRIALLALVPNGLPLVIGYGTIGLLGWELDPLAAVILALGVGIAVDDTIHVLVRARERLRLGDDLTDAIEDTLRHSGRAVAITSIVISGGLLINVFSSFPPLTMLGVLGAVVMLSALLCDLLVLPALLVLFRADVTMRPRA